MRNITRILPVLAVICGTIAAQLPAQAGAYLYAGKRKQINCGIVVVDPGNQPLGAASAGGVGDLFYLLDNLTSMKPAGWTLENPFASVEFGTTRKYGKSDAEYWIVNLNSARDLSRMHVLYFPASGQINLDDDCREKLRKFVDGGGVLWVDNSGGSNNALRFGPMDDPGTFFIPYFEFTGLGPSGQDYPISRHHPLITIPNWLTEQDIAMLGPSTNWGQVSVKPGYDNNNLVSGEPSRFEVLFPVVGHAAASSLPSVASNAYGSGRIVASANFVGKGCYMNYPYSLPSLKFAYNVLALSSTWTNARKDPRHSGGSIDTVGGTKLAKIWQHGAVPSSNTECAPVVYKNVVFYSSGNTLFALDLKPQEDLDHDGNPDDGLQDASDPANTGQDVIWTKECDNIISSPTVVTAQNPMTPDQPGNSVDAVLVLSQSGTVYMLNAFPNDPSTGRLLSATQSVMSKSIWSIQTQCPKAFPPLYINGWIYVAGGDGRIHALNPVLQSYGNGAIYTWTFPSNYGSITPNADLKAGPNFGYVSAQNSGAVMGMLYWCTAQPQLNGQNSMETNDVVYGAPIYARNDRLKVKQVSSDGKYAECQIALRGARIADTPQMNIRCKNYPLLTIANPPQMNSGLLRGVPVIGSKPGFVLIEYQSGGVVLPGGGLGIPPDAIFSADYSLDYSDENGLIVSMPNVRLTLEPRAISSGGSTPPPKTTIRSTPALGPNAMLYVAAERTTSMIGKLQAGGSVYGLQLDGANQATKWNYFLHAGVDQSMLMGASGSDIPTIPNAAGANMVIPGVVMDKIGTGWMPLQNLQASSSPAYSGDKVFVTVTGGGGGALLCFKANPDFVIRITENAGFDQSGKPIRRPKSLYDVTNNRPLSVRIWQPNLLDTSGSGQGSSMGLLSDAIPVPKDMIDYDKGTITFDRFERLKLKGGLNIATNTFSPSLPVWVLLDNIEVPVDFSTWGTLGTYMTPPQLANDAVDLSGWNNLLWYYPLHSEVHSSPVVIGDAVYFEADDGTLYAINAETGETQGRPVGNDKLIWKEPNSTSGAMSEINASPAGSNGVFLIPKADGLYAYSNTTTLVADTNRLMELDGAGELSWAADSITWPVRVPPSLNQQPASTSGPVNKPSRVRYIGSGEMLVANSGANQVCRIDKSAQVGSMRVKSTMGDVYVRWLYDKFSDPKRLLRPGQSTHLVGPTDAVLWEEPEVDSVGGNVHQMVHCLIADSGNHRIVDLVYKFQINDNERVLVADSADIDSDSGFCMPRLNWVTTTDTTNERYIFDCIQLVPNFNTTTHIIEGFDVWAAISNYRTGSGGVASNEGLGGAIVSICYRVRDGSAWNYASEKSGQIVSTCDRMQFPGIGLAPLASPRYFQVTDTLQGRYLYVCDNYGVYRALLGSASLTASEILWDNQYREMDRNYEVEQTQNLKVPLQASCVHVLPNDNWLITNNYSGTNKSGTADFSGEVFEYNPTTGTIEWHSPDLEWYIKTPTNFSWKQKIGNGQILQQPTCAFRQF
ncbi:MAG: outer membrane protein assembly factor BamB family protein [Armatimonadota bacterium]